MKHLEQFVAGEFQSHRSAVGTGVMAFGFEPGAHQPQNVSF